MSKLSRSGKLSKKDEQVSKSSSLPGRAGPSVAKEDVNVANPGKRPRTVPAKPKKKAGKRLKDYTG
jgi:hypothetical protein